MAFMAVSVHHVQHAKAVGLGLGLVVLLGASGLGAIGLGLVVLLGAIGLGLVVLLGAIGLAFVVLLGAIGLALVVLLLGAIGLALVVLLLKAIGLGLVVLLLGAIHLWPWQAITTDRDDQLLLLARLARLVLVLHSNCKPYLPELAKTMGQWPYALSLKLQLNLVDL